MTDRYYPENQSLENSRDLINPQWKTHVPLQFI